MNPGTCARINKLAGGHYLTRAYLFIFLLIPCSPPFFLLLRELDNLRADNSELNEAFHQLKHSWIY